MRFKNLVCVALFISLTIAILSLIDSHRRSLSYLMYQILLAFLNDFVILLALLRILLSNFDSLFAKTLCLFSLTTLFVLLITELINSLFDLLGVTLQLFIFA